MSGPWSEVRCVCLDPDPVDCVMARYVGTDREEALDNPCECACHDDYLYPEEEKCP